jgi:hypothetical protein
MEPEKTPKKKKKGTQFFSLGSVVVPPSGTGSAHETSFYPFQAERLIIRATRERTIYTPRPPRWVQPLPSFKGRRTLKAAPGYWENAEVLSTTHTEDAIRLVDLTGGFVGCDSVWAQNIAIPCMFFDGRANRPQPTLVWRLALPGIQVLLTFANRSSGPITVWPLLLGRWIVPDKSLQGGGL